MKYSTLLLGLIAPTLSLAMEQAIEIRDRNLNTATKPHITIINLLPKDNPLFSTTRIDISDKTKQFYPKETYRPDDSTVTIYSNQGIRFSPHFYKILEPKHKCPYENYERLGMNDAGDTAKIALYVHAIQHPLARFCIGKDHTVKFGDNLTITHDSDTKQIIFECKEREYSFYRTIKS